MKKEMNERKIDLTGGGPQLMAMPKTKPMEYENEEKGVTLI